MPTPLTGILIRLDTAADKRPVYFIPQHKLDEFVLEQFSVANQENLDRGPRTKNVDKAWYGEYGETDSRPADIPNNGQSRFRPHSL